jgi:hypothetical protein
VVNDFCGNAFFFETAWSNSSFRLEIAFNRVDDLVAACIFMHKPAVDIIEQHTSQSESTQGHAGKQEAH